MIRFSFFCITMPETKQIVFVNKITTPTQDKIVSALVGLGYAPLVDSVHGLQHGWMMSYINPCPHKLYTVDLLGKRLIEYEAVDLPIEMTVMPDLCIYFNADEEVSSMDWYHIRYWLRHHFLGDEVPQDVLDKGAALMLKPEKQITTLPSDQVTIDEENKYYTFTSKLLEEDDIMLYQVCKPYTDLPYTSIIRDFSVKGHVRFFSSLFVCPSWGVSRFDVPFLEHIWKHKLMMDGEFDMDRLLREATEACYPQGDGEIPEPEPEVYRRPIDDVINTLESRKRGVPCDSSHEVPAYYQEQSHAFANREELERVNQDVDMFANKD